MFNALLYLTYTTQRNQLRARLRRLRQPKYLLGALVGAAYFYFFVFGGVYRRVGARSAFEEFMPAGATTYVPFGAVVLFVLVLLGWIFGRDRAAINFTEAETAFLFPAPLSRRTLLHYKLLRSQITVLFGALILSFIFRRGAMLGGGTLLHALGWWLILSTLNLHHIATSFARERLFELGLGRGRRVLLILTGLALLGGAWWLVVRQSAVARELAGHPDFGNYIPWCSRLLQLPPLGWLLAPFGWLVRPYFAATWPEFLFAAGPAVLLLVVHYLWVVHSAVAFEEASSELAAKTARTMAAMRTGGLNVSRIPRKKRPGPFSLGANGWGPVAFLWKSLIALGPFWRLRTWFMAVAIITGVTAWLRREPSLSGYLQAIGMASVMFGGYLLIFAPMFMRRNVVVILDQLEMTKSYPLPGWQLVTGELLTVGVVVTFVEWLFLLAFVLSRTALPGHFPLLGWLANGTGAAVAIALLVPPLIALLLCIPLAMMLYFPAWSKPVVAPGGGGVELMGQGIIMMIAYVLVLVVALLPAGVFGGLGFFVANLLIGRLVAITVALVMVSAFLVFELAAAVWWLGGKLERFDLSREMLR